MAILIQILKGNGLFKMLKFSKATLEWAKYGRRGRNLYKPKFPVKDDLLKEPEGQLLGVVRGRINGMSNLNIYNRANTNDISSEAVEESQYDYFEPT